MNGSIKEEIKNIMKLLGMNRPLIVQLESCQSVIPVVFVTLSRPNSHFVMLLCCCTKEEEEPIEDGATEVPGLIEPPTILV